MKRRRPEVDPAYRPTEIDRLGYLVCEHSAQDCVCRRTGRACCESVTRTSTRILELFVLMAAEAEVERLTQEP